MRALLIAALLCLISSCAWANGAQTGYIYPVANPTTGTTCSPLCTSASIDGTIPNPFAYTGDGATDAHLIWLAITGDNTTSAKLCTGSAICLGQAGYDIEVTTTGVVTCTSFYELYPNQSTQHPNGVGDCQPGDTFHVSMQCTANCGSANSSEQWTISWTDHQHGTPWSYSVNWPLDMTEVEVIDETQGPTTGAATFTNAAINNFSVCSSGVASCAPSLKTLTPAMLTSSPHANGGSPLTEFVYLVATGSYDNSGTGAHGANFVFCSGQLSAPAANQNCPVISSPQGAGGSAGSD